MRHVDWYVLVFLPLFSFKELKVERGGSEDMLYVNHSLNISQIIKGCPDGRSALNPRSKYDGRGDNLPQIGQIDHVQIYHLPIDRLDLKSAVVR